MLKNYDAEAVAEVMGIAFLEERDSRPQAAARRKKAARDPKATRARTERFVIDIDRDHPVWIVDSLEKDTRGLFGKSKSKPDKPGMVGKMTVWPASPMLIEKAVENGLPRPALRHVAEQIAGVDKAKVSALEWVIVPKTTLERRQQRLSPLESERTERVARLFVHARRALGTVVEAREFMTAPHPLLDGRTPIDAARTDLGTRRTEQILNALEYGLAL